MTRGVDGFCVLLAACLLTLQPSSARADTKELARLARARAEAARKVYEFQLKRLQGGQLSDFEGLCQWSRRWLDAEREVIGDRTKKKTALAAHLDRMKKLEKMVREFVKAGVALPAQGPAVECRLSAIGCRLSAISYRPGRSRGVAGLLADSR